MSKKTITRNKTNKKIKKENGRKGTNSFCIFYIIGWLAFFDDEQLFQIKIVNLICYNVKN